MFFGPDLFKPFSELMIEDILSDMVNRMFARDAVQTASWAEMRRCCCLWRRSGSWGVELEVNRQRCPFFQSRWNGEYHPSQRGISETFYGELII